MALKDVGVRMVVDDAGKFQREIDKSDKAMSGFFNTVKRNHAAISAAFLGIGTAIVGSMALSIKSFADAGDEVQKMALRTGFSTEALSELRHAASITGTDITGFEQGTRRMSRAILDATRGLETYTRAFTQLGLDANELINLKPEEAFFRIAMAIGNLDNELVQSATAMEIFGRTGTNLLPLIAEGADGIARLREEAHTLGVVFDQEAANQAAKFKDEMTRLQTSINGVKYAAAESLLPVITDMTTELGQLFSSIDKGTVQTLTPMVTSFGLLAGAIGTVSIAMRALIPIAAALGVAMGPLALLFAGLGLIGGGVMLLRRNQRISSEADKAKQEEAEQTRDVTGALNQLNLAGLKLAESTDKLIENVSILGKAMQAEADRIFQRQLFEAGAFGGGGFGNQFDKIWGQTEEENPRRTEDLIEALISGGRTQEALSLERAAGLLNDTTTNLQNIEPGKGDVYLDGRKVGTVINDRLGRDLTQRRQIK